MITNQEISSFYQQCEHLSMEELQRQCERSIAMSQTSVQPVLGGAIGAVVGGICPFRKTIISFDDLVSVCKSEITKHTKRIKQIIRDNPKATNYTLELIQLIAPAIAQQYAGLSGMAIVGCLSIICKQGIGNLIV